MRKFLSGMVAIALAAPLAVSTAMAQYEQDWKSMQPWLHLGTKPASEAQFRRSGSNYVYEGNAGMTNPRTGYRQYQGTLFPEPGAEVDMMGTGSIGATRGMSASHVVWCREHYVSYRASDNTYKPGRGDRKECVSPY